MKQFLIYTTIFIAYSVLFIFLSWVLIPAFYHFSLFDDKLMLVYIQNFLLGLLILSCTMFIVREIRKHKDD